MTRWMIGALALFGCAQTVGSERAPCYGNGTCNDGLVCASELCVELPPGSQVAQCEEPAPVATPAPAPASPLRVAPLPLPTFAPTIALPEPIPEPEQVAPMSMHDDGVRRVRFIVRPAGADLMVDGTPMAWFGRVIELAVGTHTVTLTTRGGCCDDLNAAFYVERSEHDDVQTIMLQQKVKPAHVVLHRAPIGGTVTCRGQVVSSGRTASVPMTHPTWKGTCLFSDGHRSNVTLKAGRTITVPWPE